MKIPKNVLKIYLTKIWYAPFSLNRNMLIFLKYMCQLSLKIVPFIFKGPQIYGMIYWKEKRMEGLGFSEGSPASLRKNPVPPNYFPFNNIVYYIKVLFTGRKWFYLLLFPSLGREMNECKSISSHLYWEEMDLHFHFPPWEGNVSVNPFPPTSTGRT